MANYCSNCGAKLKANAKFCTICGTKVFSENNSAPVTLEKKSPATSGESLQERYLKMKAQAIENKTAPMTAENKPAPMTIQEIMANAKKNSQPTSPTATPPQPAAQNSSSYTPPPAPQQNYNPLGSVPPYTSDETFHDLFLKREGRLNRLRFFKRTLLVDIITVVAFILVAMIMEKMTYNEKIIEVVSVMAGICLNCYLSYGLFVRRSHDLHSKNNLAKYLANDDEIIAKWFVAITIIFSIAALATDYDKANVASSAIWLYMLFAKGETGPNKYGADPLGNFR